MIIPIGKPSKLIYPHVYEYAHKKRVLDIGCGNKAYSNIGAETITVDAWDVVKPDFLIDLEIHDLPFEDSSFDCILMIDFIEHLSRERGKIILAQAKTITSGRIYLLTPLWWDSNKKNTNDPKCWAYKNEFNTHKCLWKRDDFIDLTEIGHRRNYFFGYWEKCKKHD